MKYFTWSKIMNNRISTKRHCSVSVVATAGSGKTQLIGRMICKQYANGKKIFALSYYQQPYRQLDAKRLPTKLICDSFKAWGGMQSSGEKS